MKRSKKWKNLLVGLIMASIAGTSPLAYAENEITVGAGTENSPITAENSNVIESEKIFEFVKYSKAMPNKNLHISFYGMASFVKDTGKFATAISQSAGDYVNLTNDGVINMHFKDMAARYAAEIDTAKDTSKKYDGLVGWCMFAGEHSTLCNNGDINIFYDQADANSGNKLLVHAMYVHDNSKMINNGNINITGAGSNGTEIRGMTTEYGKLTIENNGSIFIDVKKSSMARAFSSLGIGSYMINNGEIFNRSNCIVFGMLADVGTRLINNGTVTVISEGQISQKIAGPTPDYVLESSGAYGMTYSPTSAGGFNRLINRGKIIAKVQADKNSRPDSVAAGMLVMNSRKNPAPLVLENTGVIEVSSNLKPSEGNNYLVRASEIAVNALVKKWENTNVQLSTWATNLRDFGKKKDFIQARNCSIDFSNAKLILRADKNYKLGTVYRIAPETLIAPLDGKTLADSNIVVKNFEAITFSADDSKLKVVAKKNSDGSFNVSLISK